MQTAKQIDVCPICKAREPNPPNRVCDACLGFAVAEDVPAGKKQCRACGVVKPMSEFYVATEGKDGRESTCKACRRSRQNSQKSSKKTAEAISEATGRSIQALEVARANTLHINLTAFPGLCDRVKAEAKEQYRPVEWHIAYLLSKAISS